MRIITYFCDFKIVDIVFYSCMQLAHVLAVAKVHVAISGKSAQSTAAEEVCAVKLTEVDKDIGLLNEVLDFLEEQVRLDTRDGSGHIFVLYLTMSDDGSLYGLQFNIRIQNCW